jgi:MFS family permease
LDPARRNVLLLALSQATMMTGQSLMLSAAPFIGLALASDASLATLPIGVQFGATLATVMPAAFLMKHLGRQPGFLLGALLGIAGSTLAAYAIWIGSFALFCAGLAFNGMHNGFGTYYRFAAADAAGPAFRSRAISYVLAGGVLAAFLGPNLARWTQHALPQAPFSASYVSLALVYLLAFSALLFVRIPRLSAQERQRRGRPYREIARQPAFIVAVLGGTISYGVMNLIMTSTPLAMHAHHYPFEDAAFVIQWHVVGMFAPSFVTGGLIARYGVLNVMQWGAVLCALCVGVNLASTELWAIWLALVLLGVGWNFLFVGGTTLLTETYRPEERAKTQSLNDLLVLGTTTLTALSSGPLHHVFGWSALNAAVVPLIALIALALLWLKRRREAGRAVPAAGGD